MKGFRMSMMIVLIIAVFGLSGSVLAQDASTYCYDLDEADCTLYLDLQANTEMPDSTAFTMDVSGNVGLNTELTPFAVGLSGAYTTDVAAMEAAQAEFGALTLREVSLGDVATLLNNVVSAWDASLSLDLSGIPEMAMLTNGETIDLYLVDGVAYVNSPILALVMNDPTIEGVYGVNMFEIIDLALDSVTMDDIAQALEAMAMSMEGDMASGEDFMQMFEEGFGMGFEQGMMGATAGAMSEEDLAAFVGLTRLADEESNGETVYVFETTVDIASIFTVPAIRDQVVMVLEQQLGSEMMDVDPATLMDALASSMVGSTVTVTEKYGATSNIMVGMDMMFDVTIDGDTLTTAMGEPGGADGEQVIVKLSIDYALQDVNAVSAIDLPADAQIIPLMGLLGGEM